MANMRIPDYPKAKPFTLESRFIEFKGSFMGRRLYSGVMSIYKKELKKAKKLPEGVERDNKIKGAIFLRKMLETNSLRSLSMASGGRFPYNYAEAFRDLANGHLFKGLKHLFKKITAPELPNENKTN